MQTILGSGGAIGNELVKTLKKYTDKIRLVSRNPKAVNESDELFSCDLLNKDQVSKAVANSEVAYLTVGLTYKYTVWKEQWPKIMQNVLDACQKHSCKLVFFDNIYMFSPNSIGNLTEDLPYKPSSKKGEVRAQIAQMLMNAVTTGKVEALIARSADFYGPGINNSVLNEMVYKNLKVGKKANWLCSLNYKHSFTYTPDAAKATALLGNTKDAYNQIWNLPTDKNPLTGKEWIEIFANKLGVQPKSMVASKGIVKIMGLFNPVMKEMSEMLYQYDRDYYFNSDKFDSTFKFETTSYENGVKEIIALGK